MGFMGGAHYGASSAFRLGHAAQEERELEGALLSKEWSEAPRARLNSEDFPVQPPSAELALRFLFEEENPAKQLWSAPTADDEKFSALLLHDQTTPAGSELVERGGRGEGGARAERPQDLRRRGDSDVDSLFANSSQGSGAAVYRYCAARVSARESHEERLGAKIRKVRDSWARASLHIPNVFRGVKAVEGEPTFFTEQQDLSHKAVLLAPAQPRLCPSAAAALIRRVAVDV